MKSLITVLVLSLVALAPPSFAGSFVYQGEEGCKMTIGSDDQGAVTSLKIEGLSRNWGIFKDPKGDKVQTIDFTGQDVVSVEGSMLINSLNATVKVQSPNWDMSGGTISVYGLNLTGTVGDRQIDRVTIKDSLAYGSSLLKVGGLKIECLNLVLQE